MLHIGVFCKGNVSEKKMLHIEGNVSEKKVFCKGRFLRGKSILQRQISLKIILHKPISQEKYSAKADLFAKYSATAYFPKKKYSAKKDFSEKLSLKGILERHISLGKKVF